MCELPFFLLIRKEINTVKCKTLIIFSLILNLEVFLPIKGRIFYERNTVYVMAQMDRKNIIQLKNILKNKDASNLYKVVWNISKRLSWNQEIQNFVIWRTSSGDFRNYYDWIFSFCLILYTLENNRSKRTRKLYKKEKQINNLVYCCMKSLFLFN